MTSELKPVGGSYRDPNGFVFTRDGTLYRQVNHQGRADYDLLMSSGLYTQLVSSGDLISHSEEDVSLAFDRGAYRVLRPERVPFISHPYEWCFSQLKEAARLTARLHRTAVRAGLSLKDATPYNVQFLEGRPVWIDTLSFEPLVEGAPWVAYRQFCEFYVVPLALMHYREIGTHELLRTYLDGVPVEIGSRLLPWKTRARPGLAMHVHLHAAATRRSRRRDTRPTPRAGARVMSRHALEGLVDSLDRTVNGLEWRPSGTVWADYYDNTNYSDKAFLRKRELVESALDRLQPKVVWDLGANDGTFSRLASSRGLSVLSFDVDPAAVEKNYRRVVRDRERDLLPLLMDLTNPSPSLGWAGEERESLVERGPADLVLALALVHHLAIGHNVPFDRIARFLARLASAVVIEFVPKEDSQVQRMLATREDVFARYTPDSFEEAFSTAFDLDARLPVADSSRTIYIWRRR